MDAHPSRSREVLFRDVPRCPQRLWPSLADSPTVAVLAIDVAPIPRATTGITHRINKSMHMYIITYTHRYVCIAHWCAKHRQKPRMKNVHKKNTWKYMKINAWIIMDQCSFMGVRAARPDPTKHGMTSERLGGSTGRVEQPESTTARTSIWSCKDCDYESSSIIHHLQNHHDLHHHSSFIIIDYSHYPSVIIENQDHNINHYLSLSLSPVLN